MAAMKLAIACLASAGCFIAPGPPNRVPPDGTPTAIAWRKSFAYAVVNSANPSFQITPYAVGDLMLFQVSCDGSFPSTTVSLSAPGWDFVQVGATFTTPGNTPWAANYTATVPSTDSVTVTAAWSKPNCTPGSVILGDEFANAVVDVLVGSGANQACSATVETGAVDDAVWAACSGGSLPGVGSGYTPGANDGNGDLSEYKLTADPAGTGELAAFPNGTQSYVMSAATLHPTP
jgi:hypothetical protein